MANDHIYPLRILMLGCKSVCLQFNNKQEVKSIILRGWNVGSSTFHIFITRLWSKCLIEERSIPLLSFGYPKGLSTEMLDNCLGVYILPKLPV